MRAVLSPLASGAPPTSPSSLHWHLWLVYAARP